MTQITWPSYSNDSGTFQDGTIVDETFLDSVESEINALVHSATNPTVTPADIIDEVVTSRGSIATLGGRLNVEHNADGTHNLPATVATTAVLAKSLHGVNLAGDPLMYIWSQGDSSAPDYYTLSGTGAAIDRAGTGQSTTTRYIGDYAAEITYGSADAKLSQDLWKTGDHASLDGYEGEILSFSVWVYTSTVNKAKAYVDDGNTETESSYHAGGSAWSRLEVNHTISASATKLQVGVKLEGAGDMVVSAFCPLFSDTNPDRYIPGVSAIGTIAWSKGTPTEAHTADVAFLGRPGLIKDVQLQFGTVPASGGFDFDIQIGDGSQFVLTHSSAEADLAQVNTNVRTLQVLDYAQLATDNTVVTIVFNGATTTLTEGVDWTAATTDDATATSLASAIDGISGLSATASTDTVTITIDDWVSIFAGAKTVDAGDQFGHFTPAPTNYADKCIAALHLDNGDGGTNENSILKWSIEDDDGAVNVKCHVRVLQFLRPLEDAIAYNTLG